MATYILRVVHEYISLHDAASKKKIDQCQNMIITEI